MKLLPFIAIFFSAAAVAQNKYVFTADLKNVVNDEVSVVLKTPHIKESEAVFSFAKAIPGSYAQKDFGRFIVDFAAFNKAGKKLKSEKLNVNQYRIDHAENLEHITYKVNDTWDENNPNFVFQPGGSNIEAGKDFVINNHAFFGYFEGYGTIPVEVNFRKPSGFFGSTHLNITHLSDTTDLMSAKNYFSLADNPVMYCLPDTTSFQIGKTRIHVSVYSANGKVKSTQVAEYLKPMSLALQKFFNGLPVDSYQFLYFFEDPAKALVNKDKGEGGYGALEHNYSSLYFLPEMGYEARIRSLVNDVSGHEFLHILTPLNLHSLEIENFNFSAPKMSEHLWLYEGVTEYFANLVQLQNGLISEKEFFDTMRDKINDAEPYGNFSMTEMSKNVMESRYQKKYNSVYNRGALIALMLDVCIREKTAGKKDLKAVITGLSHKYGPNRPFIDGLFFDELVRASHPGVRTFIDQYIIGCKPLPYAEYFSKIGYEYLPEKKQETYYAGDMGLRYDNQVNKFVFANVKDNCLSIKENDIFEKIDGQDVGKSNLETVWEDYFNMNTTHPEIAVTVKRDGKEMVLSGKLSTGYFNVKNYLGPVTASTDGQTRILRKLNGDAR